MAEKPAEEDNKENEPETPPPKSPKRKKSKDKSKDYPFLTQLKEKYILCCYLILLICLYHMVIKQYSSLNFLYGLGISHAEKTQNRQNISNPYTLKIPFMLNILVSFRLFS